MLQPRILHFWCRVSIPYQWYRYPIPTLESGYRYLLERVSVPLEMHPGIDTPFVDTPVIDTWGGLSVSKFPIGSWVSVLASEYRYQLPENSFRNSLKHVSLRLGP
ncbi:hypothetical protein GQ457_11G028610 [Hibiscus cannabinus]